MWSVAPPEIRCEQALITVLQQTLMPVRNRYLTARWILLALAMLALLSATVLHDAAYNLTVRPWLRLGARLVGRSTEMRKAPGLYVGERLFRHGSSCGPRSSSWWATQLAPE